MVPNRDYGASDYGLLTASKDLTRTGFPIGLYTVSAGSRSQKCDLTGPLNASMVRWSTVSLRLSRTWHREDSESGFWTFQNRGS